MTPATPRPRRALRLELAHVEVRYLPVLLPEACPVCGTSFGGPGEGLREVGYAEASASGWVRRGDGVDSLDVACVSDVLAPPWHPVRYECGACGLVLADGVALAEE